MNEEGPSCRLRAVPATPLAEQLFGSEEQRPTRCHALPAAPAQVATLREVSGRIPADVLGRVSRRLSLIAQKHQEATQKKERSTP